VTLLRDRASSSIVFAFEMLILGARCFFDRDQIQRQEETDRLLSAMLCRARPWSADPRNLSLRRSKGNVIRVFQAGYFVEAGDPLTASGAACARAGHRITRRSLAAALFDVVQLLAPQVRLLPEWRMLSPINGRRVS